MLPLWGDAPRRRAPNVTVLLIFINLAVFGYEAYLAAQSSRALASFVGEYALVPQTLLRRLDDPQAWLPVLTSMFLHGGVAHVLGNCWFFWVFGANIEDRLGSFRFALFYLLCGVGAAGLQVLLSSDSTVPMLGASGAISGVLGAFLVLLPFAWIYTLVPWVVPILPIPAFFFLLVWFGFQALNGVGSLMSGEGARGGVAWWAHAGGFLTGIALISVARRARWIKRK
jgi:membrane associated rhomboid family serine protease